MHRVLKILAAVFAGMMGFCVGQQSAKLFKAVHPDPNSLPKEIKFKSGYVNHEGRPDGFGSAMLWGIAIADPQVPGYENANVEISEDSLTCIVGGKEVNLNRDYGPVRGGLFRRNPWFGTDSHESMPMEISQGNTVMHVGSRPEKVWHFWAASSRAPIPAGDFMGCRVSVKAKISRGALLQIGMDYWRDTSIGYGEGGNNHEAGASDWYGESPEWQEATFTDVKKK